MTAHETAIHVHVEASPFKVGERWLYTDVGYMTLVRLQEITKTKLATQFIAKLPGKHFSLTTCELL